MLVMTNNSQINFADFERFSGSFLENGRPERVIESALHPCEGLAIAHTFNARQRHSKLIRKW